MMNRTHSYILYTEICYLVHFCVCNYDRMDTIILLSIPFFSLCIIYNTYVFGQYIYYMIYISFKVACFASRASRSKANFKNLCGQLQE